MKKTEVSEDGFVDFVCSDVEDTSEDSDHVSIVEDTDITDHIVDTTDAIDHITDATEEEFTFPENQEFQEDTTESLEES